MFRFGLREVANWREFRDDFARPEARRLHVGDRVLGYRFLILVRVEDCGTVADPPIVALPVNRRRIVDLEKELEQRPKAGAGRVENDLDRLGCVSATSPGHCRSHSRRNATAQRVVETLPRHGNPILTLLAESGQFEFEASL
jgi:hypothetical protein